MEEKLIASITPVVKQYAIRFYRKHCGQIRSRVSCEDLIQECYRYCLELFKKQQCSVEDFRIRRIDLKGCLCRYTQSQLSVHVPVRLNKYTERMKQYGNAVDVESERVKHKRTFEYRCPDYDRVLDEINVEGFLETLDPRDRIAAQALIDGDDWRIVAEKCGWTQSSAYRAKLRLRRLYLKYMGDAA